jgi:intracellular septation protein
MKFLFDFFPVLAFFLAYIIYRDFFMATIVIMIATTLQVAWQWLRQHRVERMLLITWIVLIVLGGVTLLLRDELFLKWKPTLVSWLFGLVLLGSQFIGDRNILARMLDKAFDAPIVVWTRANLASVIFFAFLGFSNLYVAYGFDNDTWVYFKLFGMMGLHIVFMIGLIIYLFRYMKTDAEQEKSHGR